jgi:hypothetical protein
MMSRICLVLSILLMMLGGVGCSGLIATATPTARAPEFVSTAVEQTLQAAHPSTIPEHPSGSTTHAPATPTPLPDRAQFTQAGPFIELGSATPLEFRTEVVPPQSTAAPATPGLKITSGQAGNPSATASPSPTASGTPGPSETPSRRATRTPTITPTPPIPGAGVQFVEPGPMSKLVSPLHLIANLRSQPSGTYRVELWVEPLQPGGEPRLLYREVQRIISNPVDWVYLDQDIPFELERVSEFGQLRLSVYDQYDRPASINSVDLLLLSMGPNMITPSNLRSEPIVIRQPTANQLIQGGTVIVSGLARPSEDFLLVELVAADGSLVGYRQVFVTPAADGSYVPWAVEVPYMVSAGTWVRLRVSESGTRIEGMEVLSSVEVYLSP